MILLKVAVIVPRLTAAAPGLNKSDSAFEQTPSDQQLSTVSSASVRLLDVLRLATDVEGFARFGLHSKRQFERFNPRLQLRIMQAIFGVLCVEQLREVKLPSLLVKRQSAVANVLDELVDVEAGCPPFLS